MEVEGSGVEVTARRITIYTDRGTLRGRGKATQTTTGETATVTGGTFSLTRGTGRLKGHTLKGTFSGSLANGVYTFEYAGRLR